MPSVRSQERGHLQIRNHLAQQPATSPHFSRAGGPPTTKTFRFVVNSLFGCIGESGDLPSETSCPTVPWTPQVRGIPSLSSATPRHMLKSLDASDPNRTPCVPFRGGSSGGGGITEHWAQETPLHHTTPPPPNDPYGGPEIPKGSYRGGGIFRGTFTSRYTDSAVIFCGISLRGNTFARDLITKDQKQMRG